MEKEERKQKAEEIYAGLLNVQPISNLFAIIMEAKTVGDIMDTDFSPDDIIQIFRSLEMTACGYEHCTELIDQIQQLLPMVKSAAPAGKTRRSFFV